MSKKSRNEIRKQPQNPETDYEILPTGLENTTISKAERISRHNPVDRGFSNSECLVPKHTIQANQGFATMNNQPKMKLFPTRFSSVKQKIPRVENECYEKNHPNEWNAKGFDFNCQFPRKKECGGSSYGYYEINFYDEEKQKPEEMVDLSTCPCERLPWYGSKDMFKPTRPQIKKQKQQPQQELEPDPKEPTEEYMDMEEAYQERNKELSPAYDKVPVEIPLPPIRKTISYAVVHSLTLPILRKEYHKTIPKVPTRVVSKRTGQEFSNSGKKVNKYDTVNSVRDQLKKAGFGHSKANNSPPNEEPGRELSESLLRRKRTVKIMNNREEERRLATSYNNDENQQVFYQLSDVLDSDKSKNTVTSPPRVKSPIEEATKRVLNRSNPKLPTPPLAKVNPETAPKEKLAPTRVDSKRTGQKICNSEEKVNKYDTVNAARDQLKKAGSGYSKANNSPPNEEPGRELSESLLRRKRTVKILNNGEEERRLATSYSNDENQQVFYQLSDIMLDSDKSNNTVTSPPRVKSPIEEATERVLNRPKPKLPTPPLAKENPETAPEYKLQKSKSQIHPPTSNEEQKLPQKMLNNMIEREKRANTLTRKEPPPVPTKRKSFCKETPHNSDTSMEDTSVVEGKKGTNNLVQDFENKMGLNQKSMLDNFSSKSYYPKQFNDYQDNPMNLKHVESNNSSNSVY